jgi:hypothetical protein
MARLDGALFVSRIRQGNGLPQKKCAKCGKSGKRSVSFAGLPEKNALNAL